jgi:hypothetical protein
VTLLHGTTTQRRRIVTAFGDFDRTAACSLDTTETSDSQSAAQRDSKRRRPRGIELTATKQQPSAISLARHSSRLREKTAQSRFFEHPLLGAESATTQQPSPISLARHRLYHRDMASLPPFLNLAGELRNTIYELVLLNTPLRIFEGHVNLPPLGYVCRQIHGEMTGIFEKHEQDLISDVQNGRLPIKAKIINYDFAALYDWLKRHEGTNDKISDRWTVQQVHALHIDMVIDVPVIDLTRVEESQLIIQNHIARDREVIRSLNDQWKDGVQNMMFFNLRLSRGARRRFDFRFGPVITGRGGTAAIVDGHGAKSYGFLTARDNCYVVTCDVRLNFVAPFGGTPSGFFPNGFCHQGDYLDQLFGQMPDGGPWSPGHQWKSFYQAGVRNDEATPFFKVVFGVMCRARAGSYWMLWDRKLYSQLTFQQQRVVDYYRFLDGGVERRAGILEKRDENGFFGELDAAVKPEDRMDLSE